MLASEKYDNFIDHDARVEFLEGTTAAGKTTVGIYKFMIEVACSKYRQHIIAGLDTGTIEKNIINKPHGILDEWGELVEYKGSGMSHEKLPHIVFHTSAGDNTIYILGYGDKARWKKALGDQYGILFIDEINIADIDFVRESMMRCEKVIATLNPDDPALEVYDQYINHSRPLAEYEQDEPKEIMNQLKSAEAKNGWTHWFFKFEDNISLTEEKIQTIIDNVPRGTKLYKNKIEGIRCRATGLVFSNFNERNVSTVKEINEQIENKETEFKRLVIGVDTAYSAQSADTIAIVCVGITTDGRVIVLDELVYNNAERQEPLAPSDVVVNIVNFTQKCSDTWGNIRNIYIDSADQATLTECAKWKRKNGGVYNFIPAYKRTKIIDRINLQLGWIAKEKYIVLDNCREHIRELGVYSWKDDKDEPEDRNDHTINAVQYGWLPYTAEIGK